MVLKYDRKRKIWVLVSKKNPNKVLKIFGVRKPSYKEVLKEERRVQYFKFGGKPGIAYVKGYHKRSKKGKRHGVRKHIRRIKKGGRITANQRLIFDVMASQKKEYGGELDIGKKKKLEKFTAYIGTADYVDTPDEDFELEWHTHPPKGYITPSEFDMASFIKAKENQAMVIFSKNRAIAITKTSAIKKLKNKNIKKRYDKLYSILEEESLPNKIIEEFFIQQLRRDGFIVKTFKPKSEIEVPIKVIE